MSGALAIKDAIRDFLRKYDEVTTPLIRFVMSLILFWSINSMYGYSDLFERGMVVFLLSVICALVSSPVAVMLAAIMIIVNCFSVSTEVGLISALLVLIVYGTYMRMFPKCSWILAFVPIMYIFKLEFAVPIVVAIFAGASGIIPAVFGVLLFYFSEYTDEVASMLRTAADEEDVQPFTYIVDAILKNKEMLLTMMVFAVVIMITFVIYKLPVNYSWYIAIGVGAICMIIVYPVCGSTLDVEVSMGSVILGALIGAILGLVAQFCKGMVDYSKKEVVQFEDDDYYYYVKAIPKFVDPERKKRQEEKEAEAKNNATKKTTQPANKTAQPERTMSERAMAERARAVRMQTSGQQAASQVARTQASPQMTRTQAASQMARTQQQRTTGSTTLNNRH